MSDTEQPIRWDGTSPITVVELERTCSACPSQWQGPTTHGDIAYFRYRGGHFSIALWRNEDGEGWTDIYEEERGDWLDGYMSYEELKGAVPDWITLPEEEIIGW